MKASRKLDQIVATKVMGWSVNRFKKMRADIYSYDSTDFSRDIAAAWEVVHKLSLQGYNFSLIGLEKDGVPLGYSAAFGKTLYSSSDAPHAICIAALKAIGYEI